VLRVGHVDHAFVDTTPRPRRPVRPSPDAVVAEVLVGRGAHRCQGHLLRFRGYAPAQVLDASPREPHEEELHAPPAKALGVVRVAAADLVARVLRHVQAPAVETAAAEPGVESVDA
jgi:hypothetical protein